MRVLAPILFLCLTLVASQVNAESPSPNFVVQVQSLQSQQAVEATWLGLSTDSLLVRLDNSEQQYGLSSLKIIRFPGHQPRQVGQSGQPSSKPDSRIGVDGGLGNGAANDQRSAAPVAVLRDGSRIFPSSVSGDSQSINFELDDVTKISTNVAHVQSIQLQPLTPVQRTQWESILYSRIAADTLVLVRSPESLDKIEGIVGDVQTDFVAFEFGGQALNAPRTKLAGLVYYSPAAKLATTACTVTDVWGNTWNASHAHASQGSDRIELLLACGAKVSLPLECLIELDFSRGSLLYLAEMTPIDQGWKGAIELDTPIPGSEQLFGAQSVLLPKNEGPSLKLQGTGWVTYRVPEGYSKLLGTVLLGSGGNQFTPCRALVKLEEEVVWEQQLTDISQRLDLSVEVRADRRLKIEVLPQSSFPVGDVVVWQQLRLQK